jgi:signal transduction histidine kinase
VLDGVRQTPNGGRSGQPGPQRDPDPGTQLDAIAVGVVACDTAGRITMANRMARALLEATGPLGPRDRPALYLADGVTPLPEDRWPLVAALRSGTANEAELVIATSASARRIRATATLLRDADGTATGAVCALVDVTDQRRRERNLVLANAALTESAVGFERDNAALTRSLAELEAFAAVASHDLKSPLATVAGYVQLLTHLDPDQRGTAEYDDLLAPIGKAVETMRALIDDLLAYATAPQAPLHLADVDLDGMVREIASGRERYLRHQGQPPPRITVRQLPTVVADQAMLRQVMENLIDNAVKYTAPGTAAEVEVTAVRHADGAVQVEVADRGIGIPEGQYAAVFADFHRAHREAGYPGTGLGLAICQRILTRHGGAIGARPNRGGGTRFWFTLPA